MKEKRYELIKKEQFPKRSPEGINALSYPDEEHTGDILENLSRYKAGTPRSTLNNDILMKLESSKIHERERSRKKENDPSKKQNKN